MGLNPSYIVKSFLLYRKFLDYKFLKLKYLLTFPTIFKELPMPRVDGFAYDFKASKIDKIESG